MKSAIQSEEHQQLPTQWSATTLRLAQTDIIILSAYLAPGQGLDGSNLTPRVEIAGFLRASGLPIILAGDFNTQFCVGSRDDIVNDVMNECCLLVANVDDITNDRVEEGWTFQSSL